MILEGEKPTLFYFFTSNLIVILFSPINFFKNFVYIKLLVTANIFKNKLYPNIKN